MAKINKTVRYILHKTRWPWKKLSLWIKKKLGWLGIPVIYPYTGYCNGKEVYLSGSVIEDRGLSRPHEGQSTGTNILAMIKRYVGDEFAGVRLQVEFDGHQAVLETDGAGFFECQLKLESKATSNLNWQTANYRLLDQIVEDQPEVTATGSVMMVSDNPQFMIISDVDDTFLVSQSTRILKKVRLMLFKNALTRLPFPGVAAFYKSLQTGTRGNSFNPIFYVSSSERNLYDLLYEFCEFRGIPKGPFLLRGMQTSLRKLIFAGGGDHMHKLEKIRALLSFFPGLPVILIGDSGQRDPEIYLDVIRENPGRVKAVYIRNIGKKSKRMKAGAFAREAEKHKVGMLLVSDTAEAAQHAAEQGIIDPRTLSVINAEKQKDSEY